MKRSKLGWLFARIYFVILFISLLLFSLCIMLSSGSILGNSFCSISILIVMPLVFLNEDILEQVTFSDWPFIYYLTLFAIHTALIYFFGYTIEFVISKFKEKA